MTDLLIIGGGAAGLMAAGAACARGLTRLHRLGWGGTMLCPA